MRPLVLTGAHLKLMRAALERGSEDATSFEDRPPSDRLLALRAAMHPTCGPCGAFEIDEGVFELRWIIGQRVLNVTIENDTKASAYIFDRETEEIVAEMGDEEDT